MRVYSEVIEKAEFPLPNDTVSVKRRRARDDQGTNPNLRPVTLHHIIRIPGSLHSKEILEVDARIRVMPNEVANDEIQEYQRIIGQAETEVLKTADIILCTCSASSAPRIYTNCNIQQVRTLDNSYSALLDAVNLGEQCPRDLTIRAVKNH